MLAFGLKLRDLLERSGKYRVSMTRKDDTFIPLTRARAHRAPAQGRAVHFGPCRLGAAQRGCCGGRERLYVVRTPPPTRKPDGWPRPKTRSDIIAGVDLSAEPDDVANILIDLAQRETKTFSQQFAQIMVGDIKRVAPLHLRPVKSAGFIVLKAPDVPSVLVELATCRPGATSKT